VAEDFELDPFIKQMFVFNPDRQTLEALREALRELRKEVDIWFFTTEERSCWTCRETEKLIDAIEKSAPEVDGRKLVKVYRLVDTRDADVFRFMGVDRVPTICLAGGSIRYVGMPAGEEVKSFVETIVRIGTEDLGLPKRYIDALAGVRKRLVIDVVVTPPCPYCPYAAFMANMMALASKLYGSGSIQSRIIEAYENPDIADSYGVTTVPTIAVNGRVVFVGPPTYDQLLSAVLEIARRDP